MGSRPTTILRGQITTSIVGEQLAHKVLPWVHRIFANLKAWEIGVYHGLRAKHLQSYLDEFVFRFNRRRNRPSGLKSLLGLVMKYLQDVDRVRVMCITYCGIE